MRRALVLAALFAGCGADVRLGDRPREAPPIEDRDAGSSPVSGRDAGIAAVDADSGFEPTMDAGVRADGGRVDTGLSDSGLTSDAGGPRDASAPDAAVVALFPASGRYKVRFSLEPSVRCTGTLSASQRDFEAHSGALGVSDGEVILARFEDRIELGGDHIQALLAVSLAVLVSDAVPGQPLGSFYTAVDQMGAGPSDTAFAFAVAGVHAASATVDFAPGELRFGYSTPDAMGLCVYTWGASFTR
jgi:hypothetical protein